MNANDLTNLIGALGKAGVQITVNNHYGSGDIRSGNEVTLHQAAPARQPQYGYCPQCYTPLPSVWDVSDGGLCRTCVHHNLQVENEARRALDFAARRQLEAEEEARAAALEWIARQGQTEYDSVPMYDSRTGRVIGSETHRGAPHRAQPYDGGEVENAPIIDARTGNVIGYANPKAGASARR